MQLTVERLIDKPQPVRYCVLFIFNINQFCSSLQDTKLPAAWASSHQNERPGRAHGSVARASLLWGSVLPFLPHAAWDAQRWEPFWEWDVHGHAQLVVSPRTSSRTGPPKAALAWEPPEVKETATSPLALHHPHGLGQKGNVCPARRDWGTKIPLGWVQGRCCDPARCCFWHLSCPSPDSPLHNHQAESAVAGEMLRHCCRQTGSVNLLSRWKAGLGSY